MRLGNARGEVVLHARMFDGLQPGVLVVESVWPSECFEGGIGINALTSDDPAPAARAARCSTTPRSGPRPRKRASPRPPNNAVIGGSNDMEPYRVIAYNTALNSENKIHDDAVARRFGFTGGLVPGVDVYAYMTHPAVARWGRAWLERGTATCRFAQPVYDGDPATVTAAETPDGLARRWKATARPAVSAARGWPTIHPRSRPSPRLRRRLPWTRGRRRTRPASRSAPCSA